MILQLLRKHQITAPNIPAKNSRRLSSHLWKTIRRFAKSSLLLATVSFLTIGNSSTAAETSSDRSDTKLKWRSRSANSRSAKKAAKKTATRHQANLISATVSETGKSKTRIQKVANNEKIAPQRSVLKAAPAVEIGPALRTAQVPKKGDDPQVANDPQALTEEQKKEDEQKRNVRCENISKDIERYKINIRGENINDIKLDISPPTPRQKRFDNTIIRPWHNPNGELLFQGKPKNYHVSTETAVFTTTEGDKSVLLSELRRSDQCHFFQIYNIPFESALAVGKYKKPYWTPSTFTWKASALCHNPLYFDEEHLERYGHSPGPIIGPVISAGHFFVTFPILPYKMGLKPPNECVYSLGYYRPGSCAPYMIDPIPLSVRAGLWEAGAWVGGVFLVP